MNPTEALSYVKATAAAISLPLDERRAQAVAGHLAISAAMAKELEACPLEPHDELVTIYCPAPFPMAQGGRRTP